MKCLLSAKRKHLTLFPCSHIILDCTATVLQAQPQTPRFHKATRNELRYAQPGGRQKWSADDRTGRGADYLQTTPVLCDVTLELTGDIFFLLSRAK